VWGRVSGKLAGYITQYYLDELLQFDNLIRESASIKDDTKNARVIKASQLLSEAELKRVCQDLDATLKTDYGVTLSDLRIIDLNLPPEIHQQYHDVVKTENEARIKRGEGKSAIEMISKGERKRAQAQRDLIDALADGLNNVDPQNFTDSILLSLEGILHKSLQDTAIPSVIAKDNFATLEQLRDFLKKSESDRKIS
jgi:regulator of protease activity HflC (stomatin/prohibitin superfamily)